MGASIAFVVRPREDLRGHLQAGPAEVVPIVDGVELTDRVHEFERERRMETRAVSYGGLIPSFFKFGSMGDHYLGTASPAGHRGKIPVLGCECGEWGCWPLLARVIVGDTTVTWTDFEQPYRPDRDYRSFGPFTFSRADYESAIAEVAGAWKRERDEPRDGETR
jgi:hypothetical protein